MTTSFHNNLHLKREGTLIIMIFHDKISEQIMTILKISVPVFAS